MREGRALCNAPSHRHATLSCDVPAKRVLFAYASQVIRPCESINANVAAERTKKFIPLPKTSRTIASPLLMRDRMATGTRREQRAAPPRSSPEET